VAVKIVRQPNKIALLGAPTSAAAISLGHEGAPAALRAAGLIDRLTSIGYSITDLGDDPQQLFQPDEETPRARNIPRVIASLEALKPRVEQAVKSGALPLILSVYMDRDADLHTPATTSSGSVDGMVISHVVGRGAAELVRFWSEPPLVREPDVALFGVARLDPAEEQVLNVAPLRSYLAADVQRKGAAASAQAAIDRIHAGGHDFVLHFDVDVIADFQATNYSGSGGLGLDEVREALETFAEQKHLAAVDVSAYNPAKDPDGSGAKMLVDLLVTVFQKRLEALREAAPAVAEELAAAAAPVSEAAPPPPPPPGEAWSSESLEDTSASAEATNEPASENPSESAGGSESSHSE
jgi:arginase